jgi:hypothetical protein
MKDIFASSDGGKFVDIVFEPVEIVTNIDPKTPKSVTVKQLKSISDEYKLLQSLKKLYLTEDFRHPLGYGINRKNFNADTILEALSYYNTITQTTSNAEKISEIVSITQSGLSQYEVIIRTVAGTLLSLQAGV